MREDSVRIRENMKIYFPETGSDVELTGINRAIEKFKGKKVYCVENGVLGFITNDIFYVTPLTGKKLAYLVEEQNFDREEFFIPFSDGGIPKDFKNFWQELLNDAENPG